MSLEPTIYLIISSERSLFLAKHPAIPPHPPQDSVLSWQAFSLHFLSDSVRETFLFLISAAFSLLRKLNINSHQ
jgi:hypothetical protein